MKTYQLDTLVTHINDYGKGYSAEIVPGTIKRSGRGTKKLIVRHNDTIVFEFDNSLPNVRNKTAIQWADKQFGFELMKAKGQQRAGRRPKRDIAICLMDERGLKITVKTRNGEEMIFKNVVQVEVEQ